MANMTLAVDDELYERMKQHSEFKWSEVARKAFEEKINDAELLEDLKSIARAEKEFRGKKTISHQKLLKELGL